jgi:hypothetical protein
MIWLYLSLIVVAFAGAMLVAAIRYRPPLWRWLFVIEAFLLFWSFTNCFAPGSWRQFWEFEIPLFVSTAVVSVASAILSARDRRPSGQRWGWAATPQMISLYVVAGLIALMIICH